ncbi:MAG TPA: zf-HC2 domain-containing protein [Vicinamibacterales bacterium]
MSDPYFDRALGAAARRGRDTGTCPDAEQLAAFVDGVLPRAQRDAIEAHAADCARCTEHLALLLPIAEPVARAARPRLVRWGWLVPVATAVIVAAVWVRMPERQSQDAVTFESAPAPGERAVEPGPAEAPVAAVTQPADPADSAVRAAAPGDTAAKSTGSQRSRQARDTRRQAIPSDPQTPAPMPPARTPPAGALAETLTVTDAAEAKPESAPSTAAPAPSAQAFRSEDAPDSLWVEAGQARYRAIGRRLDWSRDSGRTWQVVEPDAGAPFTAAGCDGDLVCWFGTAAGTVFRVTDGAATRLELPARAAVVSVNVTASGVVEVALASGERFRTAGTGTRWTPIP